MASEVEFNREELIRQIERSIIRGKRHAIIAITELITDVQPAKNNVAAANIIVDNALILFVTFIISSLN